MQHGSGCVHSWVRTRTRVGGGTHGWTLECDHTGGGGTGACARGWLTAPERVPTRVGAAVRVHGGGCGVPAPTGPPVILPPPPPCSQLPAPRRLPRAAPPRLRFVPRGAARGCPGGGGALHRPGWSRHRGRGGAAHRPHGAGSPGRSAGRGRPWFLSVLGNESFTAYVALPRWGSEDPPGGAVHLSHPRPRSCLPTQGQTPREKGLPLTLAAFLPGINFYIASHRREIQLFVSNTFSAPPLRGTPAFHGSADEATHACWVALGYIPLPAAEWLQRGSRGVFFSHGGTAPRGEAAIDPAAAQRPIWLQPNSSCIIILKKKNKKIKNKGGGRNCNYHCVGLRQMPLC